MLSHSRRIFFSFIFAWYTLVGFSQNWFDSSSVWIFGLHYYPIEGKQTLSYAKDTLIGGLNFKAFQVHNVKIHQITADTFEDYREFYFRTSNDSVFYLNAFEEVELIYNFNLDIGDTLVINSFYCEEDSKYFVLDSLSSIQIEDQIIRVQHLSWQNKSQEEIARFYFPETLEIIEKVGVINNGYLIPSYLFFCNQDAVPPLLRCYSDSQIHYNPKGLDCEAILYTVPTMELEIEPDILVYPNPTTNNLYFEKPEITRLLSIEVYNTKGELLGKFHEPQREINISEFVPGIYFLKFQTSKGYQTIKIVKD